MAAENDKPKITFKTIELDPKTKAKMQTAEDTKKDQAMLDELGIKTPREDVLVMRGVNNPGVYGFFDLRDMSLIRWASNKEVFKAIDRANAGEK